MSQTLATLAPYAGNASYVGRAFSVNGSEQRIFCHTGKYAGWADLRVAPSMEQAVQLKGQLSPGRGTDLMVRWTPANAEILGLEFIAPAAKGVKAGVDIAALLAAASL
jgi:hypothetical protein